MFSNALFQMRLESLLDDNSSGGEMFPQPIVIEPQSPQEQVSSNPDQNVVVFIYLWFQLKVYRKSKSTLQADYKEPVIIESL